MAQEAKIFSVDRIYAKFAQMRWPRLVTTSGYVSVGHNQYYIGHAFVHQEIEVRFDPQSKEWVFCSANELEIKRWPVRGISYQEIVKELPLALNPQAMRWTRMSKS